MKPVIIAHRGASLLAKHENTLESFQIAIDIGADYAEFDIRQTKDKKLIVFHDEKIGDTPIDNLTYNELCEYTQIYGYKVPLLSEVLKLCHGKIKLDIELKETGYERRIISMVTKEYNYSYDSFMMKSFLDTAVAKIKKIDSKITAGLLVGLRKAGLKRRINEYFPERRLIACNADFISPNFRLTNSLFMRRMHSMHKKVYIWTVNDAKRIAKCIRNKADGIISDRPDIGIAVRKKCKKGCI